MDQLDVFSVAGEEVPEESEEWRLKQEVSQWLVVNCVTSNKDHITSLLTCRLTPLPHPIPSVLLQMTAHCYSCCSFSTVLTEQLCLTFRVLMTVVLLSYPPTTSGGAPYCWERRYCNHSACDITKKVRSELLFCFVLCVFECGTNRVDRYIVSLTYSTVKSIL